MRRGRWPCECAVSVRRGSERTYVWRVIECVRVRRGVGRAHVRRGNGRVCVQCSVRLVCVRSGIGEEGV